jgi:hypothetical protein
MSSRRSLAIALAVVVFGCHDPSSRKRPSPQATGTPPLPLEPTSTAEITRSVHGQAYGRFLDASVPLHDGAAACSVVTEPALTGDLDYVVQNTGNVELTSCDVVLYAYDSKGRQLARVEVDPFAIGSNSHKHAPLQPAQALRGLLGARQPGATWEAVVTRVTFADGAIWSDPSRAPAQKDEQKMP